MSEDAESTWTGADITDRVSRRQPKLRPAPVDLCGRVLGHYRLLEPLGSGGMGTVYLAEQRMGERRVAVKVMHPELARDEALRARFSAEARTVNLIGHPNIVRIFEIDESREGLNYFVMEYLEGTPLSRLPRPMDPSLLAWLLVQACDALEAVHRSGVVHRDLKPDNLLMVERPGEAPVLKVLDFGVAHARHEPLPPLANLSGQVMGTPAYMAPEQWVGKQVDGRADIYSLAVTGYLLATGQLPYPRCQLAELVLAPRPPPPPIAPHELAPAVPEALSRALLRALARDPDARFASAAEFKQALFTAVRTAPRPAPRVPLRPSGRLPIPTFPSRPEPNDPTPPPTWTARVHLGSGVNQVVVHCSELHHDGLFMCCAEPLPALATRLEFTLQMGGEEVECVGEVVRQVDPLQARSRRQPPGVGLRFLHPSPRLRELLTRLGPPRLASPQELRSRCS
ncbi:serine/threonine-protein kinase [Cystobacter fuscus]|uniref:serine/threonine-protein kinase n=1 Tax=Cystobacter fuscus TaxID=43 RepID=UPI0037BFD45E